MAFLEGRVGDVERPTRRPKGRELKREEEAEEREVRRKGLEERRERAADGTKALMI